MLQSAFTIEAGAASTSTCTSYLHVDRVTQPGNIRLITANRGLARLKAGHAAVGVVCFGRSTAKQMPTVIIAEPAPVQQPKPGITSQAAAGLVVLAALAAGLWWRATSGRGGGFTTNGSLDERDRGGGVLTTTDSRDYKQALARTRQAVHSHNAIVFMNAGNPARALVELKRALVENSVVREPLLNARLEKQDLVDLYRLHLLNSEVPPDFPTLLQLRELFDLSQEEAEKLEQELMGSGSMFSI